MKNFASVYDAIMDDSLCKWTDFSLRHFPKDKKKKLLERCTMVQASSPFILSRLVLM